MTTKPHVPAVEVEPVTRADAAEILERVRATLHLDAAPKPMPDVERITVRDRDRLRAMAIVEQEMLESLRRCAALEQATAETTSDVDRRSA